MMTSLDRVNLLAGHAVACAEAFIEQRQDAHQLLAQAEKLQLELASFCDPSNGMTTLLDGLRMLQIAMQRTAAHGLALQAALTPDRSPRPLTENAGIIASRGLRWCAVMGNLAELVRNESRTIAERRMADAAAQPAALPGGQA